VDETSPLLPSGYDLVWSAAIVVGPLVLIAILVLAVVFSVRRAAERKAAGLAEVGAEARLAEAQGLFQRGLITADEHGEMRQRILGEV